jgi:hypothetical protein
VEEVKEEEVEEEKKMIKKEEEKKMLELPGTWEAAEFPLETPLKSMTISLTGGKEPSPVEVPV